MQREKYFDFLRGVAIIMVVAIHCYPSNLRLTDGGMSVIMICARNIMNCAVPVFLAISGYFIGKRVITVDRFDWSSYWRKQIPKVYIPCLIFSVPWLVLDLHAGMSWVRGVMLTLLCGMSVYYFILLIISCYVLAPILVRTDDRIVLIVSAILAVLSIFACSLYNSLRGGYLPYIVQGSAISFGFFFVIGLVLGKEQKRYSITWPSIVIILGFLLSIGETYFWQTHGSVGVGQKVSAFLFNAGIIFLLFSPSLKDSYKDTVWQRTIRGIGDMSFGIYFTHVLVIFAFHQFHLPIMGSWVKSVIAVMIVTMAIIVCCKKIMPDVSRRFLGYR